MFQAVLRVGLSEMNSQGATVWIGLFLDGHSLAEHYECAHPIPGSTGVMIEAIFQSVDRRTPLMQFTEGVWEGTAPSHKLEVRFGSGAEGEEVIIDHIDVLVTRIG